MWNNAFNAQPDWVVNERVNETMRQAERERLFQEFAQPKKTWRQWRLTMMSFDIRGLGTHSGQIAKAAWWVPAGVAALFLLDAIIGR
jgi:hypothetical protein